MKNMEVRRKDWKESENEDTIAELTRAVQKQTSTLSSKIGEDFKSHIISNESKGKPKIMKNFYI